MPLTIATWNVNSIKARLANATAWLEEAKPDIALLQEIKCVDEAFPRFEFECLGYQVHTHGQKSYNGVAVLSQRPVEVTQVGLPGDDDDDQARYLEVESEGVRVASIYLPNGNPVTSEKFPYKLAWMERLKAHAERLLEIEKPVVLGGDFNVIPEPLDCHDPEDWEGDALYRPESRRAYRGLINLGYADSFRILNKSGGQFSFWDYQGGAFQRGEGIRIDHLLLSGHAVDRLQAASIDSAPRAKPKASDHTPALVTLCDL